MAGRQPALRTRGAPRISVVTPAYNAERLLERTVESVFGQTFSEWELLIIDDGSTDGTLSLARRLAARDPRVRALALDRNVGEPAAANEGLAAISAASSFVTMLDADDVLEPDAFDLLVDRLLRDQAAVASHGLARYIDEDGRRMGTAMTLAERRLVRNGRLALASEREPTTFAMLAFESCIHSGGQLLFRREALERVLPCDAALSNAHDWDLWIRLSRLGHFAAVDRVVLNYRQHPSQISNDPSMASAQRAVRRKLIASPENSAEQRALAVLSARLADRSMARRRLRWASQRLHRRQPIEATRELARSARDFGRSLPKPALGGQDELSGPRWTLP